MKNKICLIALFLIGTIFYACDSDKIEYKSEFKTSEKIWLSFKETSNNSYKYTVVSSSWVGLTSETTITVINGVIVQRDFKYTFLAEDIADLIPEDEQEWTETENEIGTNQNGAEPLTLDEIYSKARNEWLKDRSGATTYFETENDGMISVCGYVENNCADDCFIGIRISNIFGYILDDY